MNSIPLETAVNQAYVNFSDSGKAAFGTAYEAIMNHIRRGDIGAAKLAVAMVSIPDEVLGVPADELATWAAIKDEILKLFP